MRLLNTETLELKWFFDGNAPPYLILSHRWMVDEVTLQQFEARKHDSDLSGSSDPPGIRKIKQFCRRAIRAKFEWVWVDTCCIDKTSSAELTESINSMWRWYQQADQCYVYLNDVATGLPQYKRTMNKRPLPHGQYEALSSEAAEIISAEMAGSDWFRRGWTLQELLAPKNVSFFDPLWNFICERDEPGISMRISKITHIRSDYFGNFDRIKEATVAERMSWMCGRRTRLAEDVAYCLLGLFDVHMPLIYGEGRNAFYRLQLEIIAKYDDESIFAWQDERASKTQRVGLLASDPSAFSWIFEQRCDLQRKQWFNRGPYRMTNKGIEFEVFDSVRAVRDTASWRIPLNCWILHRGWVCLEISSLLDGTFCRTNSNALASTDRILLDPSRPDEFRKRFNIHVRQFNIS